ncbi:pentapeptide repeat-containing protein [Nocardioides sp. ChNu-153]|uniref:pentapeptide repeat-containing protein n=1 Tax=unclassified Nocardioides TaxID=2615069 RepID=UPI0024062F06|nr:MULTISPECIES: pentapeptide repeat-containing protein [unclassified Nocardioides]MDF9715404.1 pentapeptide repeat-containing protein [Nocardioides sp. ChNu-99]MDN7120567.1 pentapeptide repeat-containing protein [Nocardioides sp. ChNu-153]
MSARRRAAVAAPRIEAPYLERLADGSADDLRPRADLEAMQVSEVRVEHLDLDGAVLTDVRLRDLAAHETDLGGARLTGVGLEGVDLTVVRASRGQWRDVEVTGRLGSMEAYESRWRSVHLVGCKLGFVNLRGAELVDVALTDCVVEELDLADARLSRVRLSGTRVGRLDVRRSEMRDVDLRGATLSEVEGPMDLGGAVVTPEQLEALAPLLAAGIGLRVEP